jgi:hypothetical protein
VNENNQAKSSKTQKLKIKNLQIYAEESPFGIGVLGLGCLRVLLRIGFGGGTGEEKESQYVLLL